jgi:hypothetical protein
MAVRIPFLVKANLHFGFVFSRNISYYGVSPPILRGREKNLAAWQS